MDEGSPFGPPSGASPHQWVNPRFSNRGGPRFSPQQRKPSPWNQNNQSPYHQGYQNRPYFHRHQSPYSYNSPPYASTPRPPRQRFSSPRFSHRVSITYKCHEPDLKVLNKLTIPY